MRLTRIGQMLMRCAAMAAVAAAGAAVVPVHAHADDDTNPSGSCGELDIYVRVTEWRGATIVRPLPIATHGGCASSWATDQMSVAAVVGQCKRLEEGTFRPDGSFFQLEYPHAFYDVPEWTAHNRAGCVRVLHGLATGELDADVLPFPF